MPHIRSRGDLMGRLGLVTAGCLFIVAAGAAQLKVDVALVNVVATVTDDRGRYVADLKPEDLIVEEDGQPQTIAHFTQSDDLPVSVGVVLDTSGSMASKIVTAARAVERFIRIIHEDDDVFLMTFAERPRLRQDFTDDRDKLDAALRGLDVSGGTALYDALDESLLKIRRGKYDKKAILLITDGDDTDSEIDFDEAALAVRESELLIYCLGISPAFAPMSEQPPINFPVPRFPGTPRGPTSRSRADIVNMTVLNTFADASGGKAWLLSGSWSEARGNQIERALDEIASELRNQYSIGYYPPHPLKDGKWHRIQIRAKNSRYRVRARKEYFGN